MSPASPIRNLLGSLRRHPVARWVLLGALVLVALVGLNRVELDTSVGSFVPRGAASHDQLVHRDTQFGGDPIVVVLHGTSHDGLLVDRSQLLRLIGLEGALANLPDVAVVYGPGTVLNQTAGSIQNVLAMISGRRDALMNEAEQQAEKAGESAAEIEVARNRAVAEFDERYAALIAQGMPMGLPTVRNPRFVAHVLFNDNGEPRPEWSFLVPDARSATILIRPREGLDQAGAEQLTAAVRLAISQAGLETEPPLVTGLPVLSSSVAEQVRTEAPLLGVVALLGVGLVFWLSPWTPRRRDRLRPLVAALLGTATTVALFGLGGRPLSLGVVAFLPILLGIGSDFPLYLNQPTHRRRVLVTAAAAAAAFASLAVSPLPFVREFGIALAFGLAATVAWALVLRGALPEIEPSPVGDPDRSALGARARWILVGAGIVAAIGGVASLPTLAIQSSPDELAQGLPQLAQVKEAEKRLGFAGEVSLVLRGKDVLSPEALAWQSNAVETIVTEHGDQMRPLLTTDRLLGFLGSGADAYQISSGTELLPSYLVGAVVSPDHRAASSSFGVVIDDVADQQRLLAAVEAELGEPPAGYTAGLVGLPVVAAEGLSAMKAGRYAINVLGIVAAGLVLWFGLRSRRTAVMSVVAALLSGGWVLAGLRVLGADLSPLTLAIGALTTVTACEFTVMLDESNERGRAWVRRSVATAVCAGTVGYLCLAFSQLQVLRGFGLTLAGGVLASYLAARLVTLFSTPSADQVGASDLAAHTNVPRAHPVEVS